MGEGRRGKRRVREQEKEIQHTSTLPLPPVAVVTGALSTHTSSTLQRFSCSKCPSHSSFRMASSFLWESVSVKNVFAVEQVDRENEYADKEEERETTFNCGV